VDIERPEALAGSLYWYLPRRDRIEGMYMKERIKRGEPIRVEDVQTWPNLVPNKCCVSIPFSLQDQPPLAELLNAESHVHVCPPDGDCIISARVQAVICDKQTPACYAIIEVHKEDEPKVREATIKGKLQLIPAAF
jgi:hypothetical protein